MQALTVARGGRFVAYVIDVVLFFVGVLGLIIEFSKRTPSSINFYGYVVAVLFLVCGAIVFCAMRSGYGGGAWSLIGLLLFAAALARLASGAQGYLQGRDLVSPVLSYSSTAVAWGAGCYCLAWGHMRGHRRRAQQQVGADVNQPFEQRTMSTTVAAGSRRST